MSYKIPFIRPDFPDANDIAEDYTKILASNWYTNFGPYERQFAEQIGQYIGEGYYASTVCNATAGLFAAVISKLGKGDGSKYVIMPSFTFAAGAHTLLWCGYKPLFIDIEPDGLHMDIEEATRAVHDPNYQNQIAGILFCNAFGAGSMALDSWEKLSEENRLPLILDSAAGFGSLYDQSHKVGGRGFCEVFSFHATKPFGIGEGGAVISRDKAFIDNLHSVINFGFGEKGDSIQLGFNGKLQEINAAIGLRQLKRLPSILDQRQAVYREYQAKLNPERFDFQLNAELSSLCFATVILKDVSLRDKLLAKLDAASIQVRTYYQPSIHQQTYFKGSTCYGGLPVTERIDKSVISIPIHDHMDQNDLKLVIDTLNADT